MSAGSETQSRPALDHDRPVGDEAGGRERLDDLGVLLLQDAAQDELSARRDEAAVAGGEREMRVSEQVGEHEGKRRAVVEKLGAGEEKLEAIGAVVHRGIP